jgi:hypothetical protein
VCTADNLTTFTCRLSWNLETSASWNPLGLSRPVMGLLYLYLLQSNPLRVPELGAIRGISCLGPCSKELQPFATKLIQSWLHDRSKLFFPLRYIFQLLFIYKFFSELTNYLTDCCNLVPSTPLREICCIAASMWNVSSQAIQIMYWFYRHDWSSASWYLFYFPADEVNEFSITLFRPSASRWRMT